MALRVIPGRAAELAWRELGPDSGRPVVLLHGGLLEPMDGDGFWVAPGIAEGLASAGLRVIVPDRRFSGGDTRSEFRVHTWVRDAADMAAIIDYATDRSPVALVAASNAVSTRLHIVARRPELVESLVLCWPATSGDAALDGQVRAGFAAVAESITERGPAAFVAESMESQDPRVSVQPFRAAVRVDDWTRRSLLDLSPTAAARIVLSTGRHLLRRGVVRDVSAGSIRSIKAPVTIVPAPSASPFHRPETVVALISLIPGARQTAVFPETPRPDFPAHLDAFVATLVETLASTTSRL